ncbi:putative aminodeoxychorismate lyase [Diaporthe ampelina]|uniref:Putative aminodeoxychorismate lyase n=1 Tax=Diaporthe ampelina TaxID=1214573 RepID=A0A0G2FTF4_9PEZI|nr:putative aminodeoxychorismate lyase [Diaporthe ampelina]
MYDQARARAGLKPTDATQEVLIVDETTRCIMEGSLTTPYFLRGGRWVTPPVAEKFSTEAGSGGQDGTTRRWALERGLAVEEEVKAQDVADGEAVWLSNGVRGFVFGKVRKTEN